MVRPLVERLSELLEGNEKSKEISALFMEYGEECYQRGYDESLGDVELAPVRSPETLKKLCDDFEDPDLHVTLSERVSMVRAMQYFQAKVDGLDTMLDDLLGICFDYGFMLKNALPGADVETILPDWLIEDIEDADTSTDGPMLKVFAPFACERPLSELDDQITKDSKGALAFGGINMTIKNRFLGFQYEDEASAEEDRINLEKKGYLVERM
jgi:hypothetical protein